VKNRHRTTDKHDGANARRTQEHKIDCREDSKVKKKKKKKEKKIKKKIIINSEKKKCT